MLDCSPVDRDVYAYKSEIMATCLKHTHTSNHHYCLGKFAIYRESKCLST